MGLNKGRLAEWRKDGFGQRSTPKSKSSLFREPNPSQVEYVGGLCKILDRYGGNSQQVLDTQPNWRDTVWATRELITKLWGELHILGIHSTTPRYKSLCREKKTGKKIYYVSSKFGATPVGYEFVGLVSSELMPVFYDELEVRASGGLHEA